MNLAELLADPATVDAVIVALESQAHILKETAARAADELDDDDDPQPVLALLAHAGRLSQARKAIAGAAARTVLAAPGQPPTAVNPLLTPTGAPGETPADAAQRLADAIAAGPNRTLRGAPKPAAGPYLLDTSALDAALTAADQPDTPDPVRRRALQLAELDHHRDATNSAMPVLPDPTELAARHAAPDLDHDDLTALGERLAATTWPPTGEPASLTRHPDLPPRPDDPDIDLDTGDLTAFLAHEQHRQDPER